jgi:hypothetical protein
MCAPSENFKLCTCADDPEKLETAEFTWKLYSYPDKTKKPRRYLVGKIALPIEKQTVHLDAATIAKQMNAGNCFDFDYVPGEFDTLYIRSVKDSHHIIHLRFNDGKWKENPPAVFGNRELLQEGIVKNE